MRWIMSGFKAASVSAVLISPPVHHCHAVTADMNNVAYSLTHRRTTAFLFLLCCHFWAVYEQMFSVRNHTDAVASNRWNQMAIWCTNTTSINFLIHVIYMVFNVAAVPQYWDCLLTVRAHWPDLARIETSHTCFCPVYAYFGITCELC